jgi:hypothetical protein
VSHLGAALRPRRAGPLLAVLLSAAGLRLLNLGEGLPDFFDEALPFRRAFDMAGWESGRVDWNPHAFYYPSLSFYLHMAVQWIGYGLGRLLGDYASPADYYLAFHVDPTPMVVAGRLVGVLAQVALLLGVAAIGERLRRGAGLLAALLVGLSATLIRDARTIYTDALMAAFAVWALERMLAYRAGGGGRALATAAALVGLAAGAKYPAAFLVVPLAWAVARDPSREGAPPRGGAAGPAPRAASRRWPAGLHWALVWGLACAAAALVFLLTSPYLLSSLGEARFHLLRIANQIGAGQLGAFDRPGGLYYLQVLVRDFGIAAPPLLAASAFLAAGRGGAHPALGTWLYVVALGVPVALGRVQYERTLVPLEPAIALLASTAALSLPDRWHRGAPGARHGLRALLVLALVAPAALSAFRAAGAGGDTTQAQARRWLESRLGEQEVLVQEAHGARLFDRWEARRIAESPAFARAADAWRERHLARPVVRAVTIPLLVAGRATVVAPGSGRAVREIDLFPSSADLNRVFYEPALYGGVDWVLTSDAVRGRYRADTIRFAAQAAFYRLLEESGGRAATFRSGGGVTGPELRVYRLTDSSRAALRARAGALDPLWWTRDVPSAARVELEATMRSLGAAPDTARPPPWVQGLGALFERQIQPFVYRLALELAEVGRCPEATSLASAILRMAPDHLQSCGIVVSCAATRDELEVARAALEALLGARDPSGKGLADIRLEYARVLAQTGDLAAARRELERVLAAPLQRGETARRARALLDRIGSGPAP